MENTFVLAVHKEIQFQDLFRKMFSSVNCKCCHSNEMSRITRWNSLIIFHCDQKTLGKCLHLEKQFSWTQAPHAQADSSLECYLRVLLEIRVHNWAEQVTGECAKDKRGEKLLHKKRKKCLRTYCNFVHLGSVCSPYVKSPTTVLLQAMGGKERETEGWDVTQRSTGHKRKPKVKDQTKKATQGPGGGPS